MTSKLYSALSSTMYHGFFLILVFLLITMAVVGASQFDNSLTDYTGHKLWLFIWSVIVLIVPGYVVINWLTDMYHLFHESASNVITAIITNGNTFLVGGFKAMLKHKREDL